MTIERTFSIIKPDAVAKNIIGEVYHRLSVQACISSQQKCCICLKNKQLVLRRTQR